MTAPVIIRQRFRGPPFSGNGGYVAGLLGARIDGTSRARLHAPPPLERPLAIDEDGGTIQLKDEGALLASSKATTLELAVPAAPSIEEARAATHRYIAFVGHPFPGCFVCGPERAEGDGLRIFPGATSDGAVAGIFAPPEDLMTGGLVETPIVWAALDCTGYFAIVEDEPMPMLLGELAVELRAPVGRGPHVVFGWPLGTEGRKARCGTAIADADGRVLAVGAATWIRPKELG